jgi:hypothetical protein
MRLQQPDWPRAMITDFLGAPMPGEDHPHGAVKGN